MSEPTCLAEFSPQQATAWMREALDTYLSPLSPTVVYVIKDLLEAGATITSDLLIEACRRGDDGLAALLLEYGADPDARYKGCWSAFAHAKRNRLQMPVTWAAMTRHDLAKKAASKRRSRTWASGQSLPQRRAM